MKIAYCTGFWSTNCGNGFFSMGVHHVLQEVFGKENVSVLSDYQTYANSIGIRMYPDRNQFCYIQDVEADAIVLAGPVLSKYFLPLWKDTLLALQAKGVRYMLLSAGMMKLKDREVEEIRQFFKICPPYLLMTRDTMTLHLFADYCDNAYDGICFSFFSPEVNPAIKILADDPFVVMNFDKINEPLIWREGEKRRNADCTFELDGNVFFVKLPALYGRAALKTDRFTDALVYALSIFPPMHRDDRLGDYMIIRTDHRFYPHYRRKIYRYNRSFVADIPHPYLELYANARCTFSDRVHACAAALAYGNSAMLFSKTNRVGLLERVGAVDICNSVCTLDMEMLGREKKAMISALKGVAERG